MNVANGIIGGSAQQGVILPRAYMISNHRLVPSLREQFQYSVNPVELARKLRESRYVDYDSLLKVDRWLHGVSVRLRKDPIAGEDFHTLFDVNPNNGYSGSLHEMLLGGRGPQELHYHPPAAGDESTSVRHVLISPIAPRDLQPDEPVGVTLKWFQLSDSGVYKADQSTYPIATGKPVSPLHEVTVMPGERVFVEFGKGPHQFLTHGRTICYALSAHFNDGDNGTAHGSYLGNTAHVDPDTIKIPRETVTVTPEPIPDDLNRKIHNKFRTLALANSVDASIFRDAIETHVKERPGSQVSERALNALVEELRYAA